MSRDILEMQFDAALEGQEVDFGSSTLGKALGFIAQAERNPSLKMIPDPDNPAQMIPNPDYVIAVAIAKQDKTSVVQTETGAQSVTIPGIDVDSIFAKKKPITLLQLLLRMVLHILLQAGMRVINQFTKIQMVTRE